MKTNSDKFIYADNDESRFHQGQIEWAEGILSKDNVIYPNGRYSHDCALDVIEESELALVDHLRLVVYPN